MSIERIEPSRMRHFLTVDTAALQEEAILSAPGPWHATDELVDTPPRIPHPKPRRVDDRWAGDA